MIENNTGKTFDQLTTDEKKQIILDSYSEDQRLLVEEVLANIKEDELSFESTEAVLHELLTFGNLGSGLIQASRQNYDLRQKLKQQRSLVCILGGVLGISLIVVCILGFAFSKYPKYNVFQTVDNSVVCDLQPENNPALTDVAIEDFAKQATLNAYSFDYINYRDHLSSVTTRYFTSKGRESFNTALRDSKALAYVKDNRLTMRTMATAVPQIENKGFSPTGKPYWIVRMPIQTEFYTGGRKPEDIKSLVATIRIETTNRDAFNAKGIGVASIVISPRGQQ